MEVPGPMPASDWPRSGNLWIANHNSPVYNERIHQKLLQAPAIRNLQCTYDFFSTELYFFNQLLGFAAAGAHQALLQQIPVGTLVVIKVVDDILGLNGRRAPQQWE